MDREAKHVGIILDGNRRYAKRKGEDPWKGHEHGGEKVEKLLQWAKDLGLKELTLYAFSMQNFKRSKIEFEYLMELFRKWVSKLYEHEAEAQKHNVKVKFLGKIHLFPKDVYEKCVECMEKTKDNSQYVLNIAFGYGGREEILDAVKKIGKDIKDGKLDVDKIDEDIFGSYLYMNSSPDFIIRTGGDYRTSNFLPWQATYSEWFFIEKTWPEFEKSDLVRCMEQFSKRERRFGK